MQLALAEEAGLFSEDSDESSDEADEGEYFDALDGNEGSSGPRTPLLTSLTTPGRTGEPAQRPPSTPLLSIQPSSPETPTQNRQREAFQEKPTTPAIPTTPVAATVTKKSKMFPLPISLPRRVSGLTSSTSTSSSGSPAPSSPSLPTSRPGSPIPVDPVTGEAIPGTPSVEKDKKKRLGGKFRRSWGGGSAPGTPATPSSAIPASDTQGSFDEAVEGTSRKPKIRVMRKGTSGRPYSFHAGKDILGIVMLEIGRVDDLPKVKNCA